MFSTLFSFNYQFNRNVDSDTFWHVKTGEYIYNSRSVPTHDIFSWYGTENGLEWINHEWLYDLIIFAVHRGFGLYGTAVFTSVLAGAVFYALYGLILIRCRNPLLSLVLSLAGISGLIPFMTARPQSVSFLLLIAAAVLMERKKHLWVIPVIVTGVNLHGGFYPMYILLTAYYLWREKPLIIPMAVLSVLINPYGAETLAYPFRVQLYPEFNKYIIEWMPTTFIGNGNEVHLAVYLLLLLSVFNKRIRAEDAVFSVILAVMTITAERHMAFLYLLVIPVLSPYIAMNGIFHPRADRLKDGPASIIFTGLAVLMLAVVAFTTDFRREVSLDRYPREAVRYIKNNNLDRICNMYNDGGFLIYNEIKPFIDGRADIFAPVYNNVDLFGEYCRFLSVQEDFKILLDKYNIDYLLVNKKEKAYLAMVRSGLFNTVYQDDLYVIWQYNKTD
ncbi:MAG: hypothetical protein K6T66_09240 [Peptococcaceae bacterium]|nr:hypothetical protein [Peptococcaceae bacterium]